METKFTKGEWILNRANIEIVSENDCSKNGGIDIIAQCFCGFDADNTSDEAIANAKLIAAAPKLFDALYNIASGTPPATEREAFIFVEIAKNVAEEALKKATE